MASASEAQRNVALDELPLSEGRCRRVANGATLSPYFRCRTTTAPQCHPIPPAVKLKILLRMESVTLALVLTPHGHLVLAHEDGAPSLDGAIARRLQTAFERGSGSGLLWLGANEVGTALPPVYLLLARIRRPLRDRSLHPAGRRRAAPKNPGPQPSRRRAELDDAASAAHDRRRVSDGRRPQRALAGVG